jgi:hypothetical protein
VKTVSFDVYGAEHCPPLETLDRLLRARRLPNFSAAWGGEHDCHSICADLTLDLHLAGESLDQWVWLQGDCARIGEHSWIEVEGFAIDAANGARRPVAIMRANVYRETMGATNVRRAVVVALA